MGIKRPFTLAIEDNTREELKALADEKNMTLSAYACMVLEIHIDSRTFEPTPDDVPERIKKEIVEQDADDLELYA